MSETRDKKAALAFFRKTIGSNGLPDKITIDKSGANKAALDEINVNLFVINLLMFLCGFVPRLLCIIIRQIKYLNNIVEQDHRFIKKITKPMMGFKSADSAKATLAGIELHRMLKKGQHDQAANMSIFEQFYGLAG